MSRTAAHRPARPPLLRERAAVGARIRELRKRAGMSQTELGSGRRGRSTICRVESGRINPSIEELWQIAQRLNVPLRSLFPRDL